MKINVKRKTITWWKNDLVVDKDGREIELDLSDNVNYNLAISLVPGSSIQLIEFTVIHDTDSCACECACHTNYLSLMLDNDNINDRDLDVDC